MTRTLSTLALAGMLLVAGVQRLAAQGAAMLSSERARAIATAGVANQTGVISEKLKTKDGVVVYEFDIETPGPGHQEVRVDAHSGAIVASRHESDVVGKAWNKAADAADKVARKTEDAARDASRAVSREVDRVFSDDDVRRINP